MKLTSKERKVIALLKEAPSVCTGEIRDIIELDTMSTIFLLQDMVKRGLIKDLGANHGDNEYASI